MNGVSLRSVRDMTPDEPTSESDSALEPAFHSRGGHWLARGLKRLIDVFGSALGLAILAPFLFSIFIAIRIESPGKAIFRQRRSGYLGKTFNIYKFRTMRVTEDGPNIVQATRDDQRITGLGRVMRRTSIDELPQLINVLIGDMSLVGPRPHALAHDEYYGAVIQNYDERFVVRPGITGLAQVSGLRGPTEEISMMAARVEKDLEYIRTWSLVLDLKILFQTLAIFAFQPEAH